MTKPKVFKHFKGLLVCYLEILRFVIRADHRHTTSLEIAKVCGGLFDNAVNVLSGLSKEESFAVHEIDRSPEGLLTVNLMTRQAQDRAKIFALQEGRISTIRRAYKAIRRSFG